MSQVRLEDKAIVLIFCFILYDGESCFILTAQFLWSPVKMNCSVLKKEVL